MSRCSLASVSTCLECGAVLEPFSRFCGHCGREVSEAIEARAGDPWIGKVIDRRYRVVSLLGSGGMGLVYKVEHLHLGKNAAMKVLRPGSAQDAEAVRRFRVEARAVSRLNHPNIVQTFDFGLWEGALYLVMEYINGEDLASLVLRHGPLPYHRAIPLFGQICSALTEAHDLGVIHRDVKPENLMVVQRRDRSEHAKVLDFGLAKLREHTGAPDMATGNQVIGSPDYMSPEQIRAEPLDERADIYGLGASLYRVLTGTAPFSASSAVAVLTKHILDPLEPVRHRRPDLEIPESLGRVVEKSMAKARDDRQESVAELQRELEAALAEAGVVRRPPRQISRLPSPTDEGRSPPPGSAGLSLAPSSVAPRLSSRLDESSASGSDIQSGDGRLRRSEFDAFERSLRRRKWLWLLSLPVALIALTGLWATTRNRERVTGAETEPNNTPATATNLRSDSPMSGHIGKREVSGQPDLDYFHVPAGKGSRAVSARLDGISGVDMVLELFDSGGDLLAKSDSRGVGGGEWIQPTVIGPSDAYFLVRQLWIQGEPLLEDIADGYRLTATWRPVEPGWESEPNDRPEQATAARVGTPMKGYLGTAADHDWFEYRTEGAGTLVAHVVTAEGVVADLVTEPRAGELREEQELEPVKQNGPRSAEKEQERGRPRKKPAATASPLDTDGHELRLSVTPAQTIRLAVVRRPTQTTDLKAAENTVGLDSPYELVVELSRSPLR
jgi:serine/threonine protein kinase